MATRTLEVWWSPVAEAWRVEDHELFTYYDLDHVIGHLQRRDAAALVVATPHGERTDALVRSLQ